MIDDASFNDNELRQYQRAYSVAVRRYLPMSNVIGIAVGPREQEDGNIDWTGRFVLQIRVADAERLGDGIPDTIEMIPTQVLEGKGLEPVDQGMRTPIGRTDPIDPLRPGASIGIVGGPPGTLGMFVDRDDVQYILTADHVIAPQGHGDDSRVYQPGPVDHPVNHRSQIGWAGPRLPANGVSLVRLDTDRQTNNTPLGSGIQLNGTRRPGVGDILEKSGRSTEITRAKVARTGAFQGCKPGFELVSVDADPNTEISMGGDSGAIWYDPTTGAAVGVQCRGDGDLDHMTEWARAASLYYLAPHLELNL